MLLATYDYLANTGLVEDLSANDFTNTHYT